MLNLRLPLDHQPRALSMELHTLVLVYSRCDPELMEQRSSGFSPWTKPSLGRTEPKLISKLSNFISSSVKSNMSKALSSFSLASSWFASIFAWRMLLNFVWGLVVVPTKAARMHWLVQSADGVRQEPGYFCQVCLPQSRSLLRAWFGTFSSSSLVLWSWRRKRKL